MQRGNVSVTDLQVVNAILYVAEHGCKWRGLPKGFGNWHTIYTRMNRWAKAGVLDRLFEELQHQARSSTVWPRFTSANEAGWAAAGVVKVAKGEQGPAVSLRGLELGEGGCCGALLKAPAGGGVSQTCGPFVPIRSYELRHAYQPLDG